MIKITMFLVYVVIDAIWDKDLVGRRKNVHTIGQYILRALIIGGYTLLWGGGFIDFLCWVLIYWFIFDGFFGYLHKRDVFYLSEKGIDGLQLRLGGQPAWFFFKFLFAGASAAYLINPNLFYY